MKKLSVILAAALLGFLAASCAPSTTRIPSGPVDSIVPEPQPAAANVTPAIAASQGASTNGPLIVSVTDAILMGLENNRSLKVQRLQPAIRRTYEEEQDSLFDPFLQGLLQKDNSKVQQQAQGIGSAAVTNVTTDATTASLALSKLFSPGTQVALDGTVRLSDISSYDQAFDSTRIGVSVTQPLLKGAGREANLASIRQAQLDTQISEYELRAFAESLVARIAGTYWDYVVAQRQIEIYTNSLGLAEQQLAETRERIAMGKMAEVEVFAAQAEVAARQEGLITARGAFEKTRLQLLSLLNIPSTNLWQRELTLVSPPVVPQIDLGSAESHVAAAMRMRPDLNEARLRIRQGDLELVKTKNGLLPKMDLFIRLGSTGYAESFGSSAGNMNGDYYDVSAGLKMEYPFGNSAAEARHERARLTRSQSDESFANLLQLAEVDVRSAIIEVNRTREQVAATKAVVKFREEALRAETEKFRIGQSTTLLVAQAERDLLADRIQEIQVVINHRKALIELFRLEGSLLDRHGISASRPAE